MDAGTQVRGFSGLPRLYYSNWVFGALASIPSIPFASEPTPVEELARLRGALGGGPRLLVKRDDAIGFAFGGNKVRKIRLVAADALAQQADTLITAGGVQSNHARVTAAAAAKLGLRCILVANGASPERPTANALLDRLLGADIQYVPTRADRTPAMHAAADRERQAGRRPYIIPIGASTPLGAAAFAHAVTELLGQISPPDVIVHASSSGGTQAGLVAGCTLAGVRTRVVGISADETSASLAADIRGLLDGLADLIGIGGERFAGAGVVVDDGFVGEGYGVPTMESRAALQLLARTEALFLDPTYTAKAMAGLIAYLRRGEFRSDETVLFWHTGGQVAVFA
jgi:1-aminocyclopropane-1-carboxylate deaminase/D-cysteine desulfhydrase-like pyridoxal-dependent ACC family enzyme